MVPSAELTGRGVDDRPVRELEPEVAVDLLVHAALDEPTLHAHGREIPPKRCADHVTPAFWIFPVEDLVPEGAHQAFERGVGRAPVKRLVGLDGVIGLLLSL